MGIEPTPSAWKAEVLPLNYTRLPMAPLYNLLLFIKFLLPTSDMEGGGFEPPKAKPSDLQSDPFDRSGTPPKQAQHFAREMAHLSMILLIKFTDKCAL